MHAPTAAAENHVVHFYDDDSVLSDAVSHFLKGGLEDEQPVIVIATQRHCDDFVQRLVDSGVDVDERTRSGAFLALDARETLGAFMRHGRPDPVLFESVVGRLLERTHATNTNASVRAYGEMVDVLCRDGQAEAAVELEELWNKLAHRYEFSLFCAYMMDGLRPGGEAAIARVQTLHAKTLAPGEPFAPSRRAQVRAVTDSRQWTDAESFRLLVDSVTDYAIFVLDRRGVVRTWNRGAARIKGYQADEIIGQHFSRFYEPEDVASGKCELLLEQARVQGRVEDRGFRVRKDGTRFWASVLLTALRDERGEHIGFAKVTRDLTDVRRVEEERVRLARETAARETAERSAWLLRQLHAVAGALGAAHTPEDIAGIVTRGAKALGAVSASFAWPDEKLDRTTPMGAAFLDRASLWIENAAELHRLFPALPPPTYGAIAVLPLVVEDRALGVVDYRYAGSRVFSVEERTLLETMASQAAQSLDRAQAYARAAEANLMKDEFLATVSHELRTPLTSMFGWSALLKDSKDPGAVATGLATIHRAAQAQIKLVDDLLDISRIIAGKLVLERTRVDLALVANEAVEVVRPTATTKNVALVIDGCTETAWVEGDAARIQQVVLNLLSNAVKFTGAGGMVLVSLAQSEATTRLSVRDTGCGIKPEFLPHVFERFRQESGGTTRRAGGLGLGLAIAKHIVMLHGGDIDATSNGEGQGAVFTVTLPRPLTDSLAESRS